MSLESTREQVHEALAERLLPAAPRADVDALLDYMEDVQIAEGEAILTAGQDNAALWYLAAGRLQVEVPTATGPLVVAEILPNHWVGEVGLLDGGAATATVRVAEASRVFRIDRVALDSLRERSPDAALALVHTLSIDLVDRIRGSNEFLRRELGREEPGDWHAVALRWVHAGNEFGP